MILNFSVDFVLLCCELATRFVVLFCTLFGCKSPLELEAVGKYFVLEFEVDSFLLIGQTINYVFHYLAIHSISLCHRRYYPVADEVPDSQIH